MGKGWPLAIGTTNQQSDGWQLWGQVLLLVLGIYLFLVSIGLLGAAFKLFGKDLARQIIEMTSNPLVGLVAGILATTIAQSSSSTTSIVVGMVAGGRCRSKARFR